MERGGQCKQRAGNFKDNHTHTNATNEINTVTAIRNAFGELIGRLGMAKGQISELEDMSIETPKMQMQREKK